MKTDAEFRAEMKEKYGDWLQIKSPYRGSHAKVLVYFPDCRHEKPISATHLQSGIKVCPLCAHNQKHDTAWYKKQVKKIGKGEYIVKGEYINNHTPVELFHKVCGNPTYPVPKDFIKRGGTCDWCSHNRPYTHDELVAKLREHNIVPLDSFNGVGDRIEVRCLVCNYKRKAYINSILAGHNCPRCSHRLKITIPEFKRRIYKIFGNKYTYKGNFTGYRDHVDMWCNKCNLPFSPTVDSLLQGHGCPSCASSHGEQNINKILREHHVSFESQKTFSDCKDKQALPFDFYLQDLNTCIEYDGKQHTVPVKIFGGEEGLKIRQYHDQIKNKYCRANDIRLIRIPYTVKGKVAIEQYLKDKGIIG